MRYLSIAEVLDLHQRLLADSGGATGVLDLGALESAVSQPHAAFGGMGQTAHNHGLNGTARDKLAAR